MDTAYLSKENISGIIRDIKIIFRRSSVTFKTVVHIFFLYSQSLIGIEA